MQGRRGSIARLSSNFYRDQFRKTLNWISILVFIMFILIGAMIYVILARPEQTYYANTSQGRILPMTVKG